MASGTVVGKGKQWDGDGGGGGGVGGLKEKAG